MWNYEKSGNNTNVYNCPGLSQTYETDQRSCYPAGNVDNTLMQSACSSKVKNLNLNLVRIGGKRADRNNLSYDQWLNEIDLVRSLGFEPIIQVGNYNNSGNTTEVYNLINYLNNTKAKGIKYVEIGNEPDQYPGYIATSGSQNKADYVATKFRTLANEVKHADGNISIIGPSLSFYDQTVYGYFLSSTNSASLIGSGTYGTYLDIVDVHSYKFGQTSWIRSDVNDYPSTVATTNFSLNVLTNGSNRLLDQCSTANVSRSSPLKFSVSELNVCWQNETANTFTDESANSFVAGQYLAEMYAVILDKAHAKGVDVGFVAPWSIYESGGNESSTDLGLIDGSSPCTSGERSTYRHISWMGKYFKGDFYRGPTPGSYPNLKFFGTKLTNGYYAIMILNQDNTSRSYTLNGNSTSGTGIILNFGASNLSFSRSDNISAYATQIVFFNCSGTHMQTVEYNQSSGGDFAYYSGTSGSFPLSLSASSTPTGCTSSTSSGSASVSASGGTGSYTYSWWPTGGSGGTTGTYSSLSANTYIATVSNSSGCTAGESVVITIAPASPSVNISPYNSCASSQAFSASVTGGSGSYTYSWAGITGSSSSVTSTKPTTNNTVNEYTLTVTDSKGCANTAVCSHYADHSLSISGPSTVGNCCALTLTADYIPGASYSWTKNGTAVSGATTHILSYGLGFDQSGTYVCTAIPGTVTNSNDPCTSSVTATKIIGSNTQNCNCGQGPAPRLAFTSTTENISSLVSIIPNPSSDITTVNYNLQGNAKEASLELTNLIGQGVKRLRLSMDANSVQIDCQLLQNGIYFATLVVDGATIETKKLMIQK